MNELAMKAPILLTSSGLLPKARRITIPLTEHDTTRYSRWAQAIAHTFFLCPNAALNTAWVDNFRPVFVRPDERLPAITDSS